MAAEAAATAGDGDGSTEEEEFRNWKRNAPLLYDLVLAHALEWPSLTVQWLPSAAPASAGDRLHRLLLGTYTSDGAPNHLMAANVRIPSSSSPPLPASADLASVPWVSISKSVAHEGEVNRARYMPQRAATVATKTCQAEVRVFELDEEGGSGRLSAVLRGHDEEGYGLSWSPIKEGWLLSGSYDKKICFWDLRAGSAAAVIDAHQLFEAHEDLVEDVAWHMKNENVFGSVGDDCKLMIWDLRSSTSKKPEQSISAHSKEVNSLSFHPLNGFILATASADKTVNLFDLRKLSLSLHTFESHMSEVLQVEWNPRLETVLASSSADKRVLIWDLDRIGDEQAEEDAEEGPPELLFSHGGHTAKISEISWHPDEPWVIGSVAEDNILQVWKIAESIYKDDSCDPVPGYDEL